MKLSVRAFLALLERHGVMAGESWSLWRTMLIAANGEKLDATERERFVQFAGREPLAAPVPLAAFFVGRRGGKDVAAAVQLVYLALCGEWRLARGELGVAMLLAVDRAQSRVAFSYVRGIFESVPLLSAEVANITADAIELKNGVLIQIATSDHAAVRGRTLLVAVLDEYAFWPQESAEEVLRALKPAMATQPHSRLIVISSVYARQGIAYEMFCRRGQDVPHELIVVGTTRDFNPTIEQAFIDREVELDPQGASAEYLSIPRGDVALFIDRPLYDAAVRVSPRELPRLSADSTGTAIRYFAAVDVSGGRNDAAAAAIASVRADRPHFVIVNAVRRWPSPHDPVQVASSVAAFLREYGLDAAVGDAYAAEFATSTYREAGVTLMPAPATASEAFLALLPQLTSNRIELPDDPHLRRELLALERRTGRSGIDTVCHPPRGHDDTAAAVALAALVASQRAEQPPITADQISLVPLSSFDGYATYERPRPEGSVSGYLDI